MKNNIIISKLLWKQCVTKNNSNLFILSEECQEDTKTDTLKRINKSIIKVFSFALVSFRVYIYHHDEQIEQVV